jgi:hypothetical protein
MFKKKAEKPNPALQAQIEVRGRRPRAARACSAFSCCFLRPGVILCLETSLARRVPLCPAESVFVFCFSHWWVSGEADAHLERRGCIQLAAVSRSSGYFPSGLTVRNAVFRATGFGEYSAKFLKNKISGQVRAPSVAASRSPRGRN